MNKLLLILFLLLSVTLSAQVNTDRIVPTCQIEDTTKSIYVTYSVILFQSDEDINVDNITIKDDLVSAYSLVTIDPITYKVKYLCALGLRDDDIDQRFGLAEEFANYLVQIHKPIYPDVYIQKIYTER